MKGRLPVNIENRELPIDNYNKRDEKDMSGFVNVITLSALITFAASIMTIISLIKQVK